MKIETALRKRDDAIRALLDMYSNARIYGPTSQEMNEQFSAINARLVKAPEWTRAYLSGYRRALDDDLYRAHLVFGGKIDGVFYSTHRDRDDYYEKHGIEPSAYADDGLVKDRGHYWRHNLKPFFIG